MIHRNLVFACPNLAEKPIRDLDSCIPDQLIIALITKKKKKVSISPETNQVPIHTSEKAGAQIFLDFFHSSPSEAIILRP